MAKFVRTLTAGLGVMGLTFSTGCVGTGERAPDQCIDHCAQERYTSQVRGSIMYTLSGQVENGHILDQTIWNYNFEYDSDKLNPSGIDKLDQIVRRRPQPDGKIFLATSTDIPYDSENPPLFGNKQKELDAKRVSAIKKYLAARTTGHPMTYEVYVHDPADPGMSAISANKATQAQLNNYGSSGSGSGLVTTGNASTSTGGNNANASGSGNTGGNNSGNSGGAAQVVPR